MAAIPKPGEPNAPFQNNWFRQQIGNNVSLENFHKTPGAQRAMREFRRQGGNTLRRELLPAINSNAAMYGALGDSNAALARGTAATRVGESIQGGIGSLLQGLYSQALGAMGQQAGQVDAYRLGHEANQNQRASIAAQRATALKELALREALGFGEQNRLNALAGLEGQKYYNGLAMQQQMLPFSMLQELSSIIGPIAGNFGSTNTTGTNVVPGLNTNPWQAGFNGGIGGLLAGQAFGGSFGGGGGGGGYTGGINPAAVAYFSQRGNGYGAGPVAYAPHSTFGAIPGPVIA